jgi:putative polyhydroxyalkanoate system protein
MVINRSHNLEKREAKQRVERAVRQMADGLGVDYNWKGDKLEFGRLGVNGHIDVDDNEITVVVNKSLFIPISDSTIREQIEGYLDAHFS